MTTAPTRRRSTAKRLLHFFVSVAIALLLGRISEALLHPETIEHLQAMQTQAKRIAGAFAPWNLAALYWCETGNATADPLRCSLEGELEGEEVTGLQTPGSSALGNPSDPFAVPDIFKKHYDPSPPPQPRPTGVMGFYVPLVAVLERLIEEPSTFGSVFALAQFVVGFLVVIAMGWGRQRGPLYYMAGVPLGTIFFGCIAGWCTRILMLAGVSLFGWATKFAALCCGSAGLAYFGYEFSIKALEVKAHEAATHVISKP